MRGGGGGGGGGGDSGKAILAKRQAGCHPLSELLASTLLNLITIINNLILFDTKQKNVYVASLYLTMAGMVSTLSPPEQLLFSHLSSSRGEGLATLPIEQDGGAAECLSGFDR